MWEALTNGVIVDGGIWNVEYGWASNVDFWDFCGFFCFLIWPKERFMFGVFVVILYRHWVLVRTGRVFLQHDIVFETRTKSNSYLTYVFLGSSLIIIYICDTFALRH